MTNIEDPLARALREVPTNGQRPLDLIERRARAIRLRRRATVAGVALAAACAIAVPSLTPVIGESGRDVEPAGPVATGSGEACETWGGEQQGDFLTLAEVPDQMRLLWTQAPAPTEANMVDFTDAEMVITDRVPADCVVPGDAYRSNEHAGVRLITVEHKVVTRVVTINGPIPEQPQSYDNRRVLETAAGPLVTSATRYDRHQAVWPAENEVGYWVSWIHGDMGDAELIELAESVTMAGDRVDLGKWSGMNDRTVILRASGTESDPDDYLTSFNLLGGPMSLMAWQGPFPQVERWKHVDVGDQIVDINGQPGLLRTGPTGQLRWVTTDGVLVQLEYIGRDGQEDLLSIARSVQPVSADDERLTAIWQDEPDE